MTRPWESMWQKRCLRVILPFLFLIATGCASAAPGVGQVTGTVRYKDHLLKSDDMVTWTVVFVSQDGTRSTDTVGRSGKYSVHNVRAGPVKIAVIGAQRVPSGLIAPGESPPRLDEAHRSLLKRLERFKNPDKSGLTYNVVEGIVAPISARGRVSSLFLESTYRPVQNRIGP
jgi:hypothetical protein